MPACNTCRKKSKRSASRSHSNIQTLRRQKPNLQKMQGVLICAKCIRTLAKERK